MSALQGFDHPVPAGLHVGVDLASERDQRLRLLLEALGVLPAGLAAGQMLLQGFGLLGIQGPEHVIGDSILHLRAGSVHGVSPCAVRISCNSLMAVRSFW